MNSYIDTIKSKGWDNFMKTIENEFKYIREELSIKNNQQEIVTISNPAALVLSEQDEYSLMQKISSREEDIKEFKKIREELNINYFAI